MIVATIAYNVMNLNTLFSPTVLVLMFVMTITQFGIIIHLSVNCNLKHAYLDNFRIKLITYVPIVSLIVQPVPIILLVQVVIHLNT